MPYICGYHKSLTNKTLDKVFVSLYVITVRKGEVVAMRANKTHALDAKIKNIQGGLKTIFLSHMIIVRVFLMIRYLSIIDHCLDKKNNILIYAILI